MPSQDYEDNINVEKEQYRNNSRAIDRLDNEFLTGSNAHISDDFQTQPHAAYVFKNGSEVSNWTDVLNKTSGSSNVFEIYQWSEGKYCLN